MKQIVRGFSLLMGVTILGLAFSPSAGAGTFTVEDCTVAQPDNVYIRQTDKSPAANTYVVSNGCPTGYVQIKQGAGSMPFNHAAYFTYTATAGSKFAKVSMDYRVRQGLGFVAKLGFGDVGSPFNVTPYLRDEVDYPNQDQSIDSYDYYYQGFRSFRFELRCSFTASCPAASDPSLASRVAMKNVIMTIDDFTAPVYADRTGGTLTPNTAHAGIKSYQVAAHDDQSGIERGQVLVNGQVAATANGSCDGVGMVPCGLFSKTFQLDTRNAPFVNNAINAIQFCASDYADGAGVGNTTCSPVQYFGVVN